MLDVNGTREVVVGGARFTVSVVPYAVVLECGARDRQASRAVRAAGRIEGDSVVPVADTPEAKAALEQALDRAAAVTIENRITLLRWGLRTYADATNGVSVTVDGQPYRILSPERAALFVTWGSSLGADLEAEIVKLNVLSGEDLLGFLRPFGS